MERTKPHGLIIGIDLIPAQPPRGVNTIQGDFLSPIVQRLVKNFVRESHQRRRPAAAPSEPDSTDDESDLARPSYIDMERHASQTAEAQSPAADSPLLYRVVDVRDILPPSLIRPSCGLTCLARLLGCFKRHVSTLGANLWLQHEHFE